MRSRLHRAALLLLLGGQFALATHALGESDLVFDEVASLFVARRSFLDLLRYTAHASREHPPFYYLLLHGWMAGAGESEFAVRFLSVLTMTVALALFARLARRYLDADGTVSATALLAASPFALWAARTARMYALVVLLAVAVAWVWGGLLRHPARRHRFALGGLLLLGAMTHYELLTLWAVGTAVLVLRPRETRAIRIPWAGTSAAVAAGFLLWSRLSGGTAATLGEIIGRFPASPFRGEAVRTLALDLLFDWHHPTLHPALWIALALLLFGWGTLLRGKQADAGQLWVVLWGTLPIAIALLMPEALNARYVILCLPPIALGVAVAMARLRPALLRLGLAFAIATVLMRQWVHPYTFSDRTTSEALALVREAAGANDLLLFNGPWPQLFTTYYPVPAWLDQAGIPPVAPPHFDPATDIPRLEALAREHAHLWVFYGATQQVDPHFGASQWLAEHAYEVLQHYPLYLYVPQAAVDEEAMQVVATDLPFGTRRLVEAAITPQPLRAGETLLVRMVWEGEGLSWRDRGTLALVGEDGRVWLDHGFNFGAVMQEETLTLPSPWTERRGFVIPPGLPPGRYTLGLKLEGQPSPEGAMGNGFYPLATLSLSPANAGEAEGEGTYHLYLPLVSCGESTAIHLPIPNPLALEGAQLGPVHLLGVEVDERNAESYPVHLRLWWRSDAPITAPMTLSLRLEGPSETPWFDLPLGPTFYPAERWQVGEVVQQQVDYPLPRRMPAGTYLLAARLLDAEGKPLPAAGSRHAVLPFDYLRGSRLPQPEDRLLAAAVEVESLPRHRHPPILLHRTSVRFGDLFRLRGYRLESSRLHAGESTTLVEYWQPLRDPPQIYAVFNHLRDENGQLVWQADSWPRAGLYTTDHWVAGEVVAEQYTLIIPEGTPPGRYTLQMGMYDPFSGARLPALGKDGQRYPDEIVPLLTLEVVP